MNRFFTLSKYQVVIDAGDRGLSLPPYKGSTLRGGFGSAFRRITCAQRHSECNPCLLRTNCPYSYIFETSPPPGSEVLSNYESIPRPFVLEPPLETRTEYSTGEKLNFNLILIGRAVSYLPYFIVAFRELGDIGIGRMRKKYRLAEIRAVDFNSVESQVVYKAQDQLVRNVNLVLQTDILAELAHSGQHDNPCALTLDFQTMTRIKYEEGISRRLEFHMLIRNLLRRLSSLAYFHHGWEMELDFPGLIQKAAEVSIAGDHTRWVDWERYSSRKNHKMNLGGLVGRVTYHGPLAPFMPLLRMGELIHVGKGAVFGMGKYCIIPCEPYGSGDRIQELK